MRGTHRSATRNVGTTLVLLGSSSFTLGSGSLSAAELPVPCVSGVCGAFVTSGQASAVQTGNTLTVGQESNRAILNWASFNISADGSVVFKQAAGKDAITLNRIHDKDPSKIFGSLTSAGQLYLINQNGILFGSTSKVNVGGLLASTLDMSDETFNKGLLSALEGGAASGTQNALAQAGAPATIAVQPGAKLTTNAAGQRILLAASTVENAGDITAVDGGQVVLAAGQKVYLAASSDASLRGLLIEVDGGGTVTNTGSVTAQNGNVTAVGLAVNQDGRISSTTSVSENGSIRLLARDTAVVQRNDLGEWALEGATRGGALKVGSASVMRVDPDTLSKATAVDDQAQLPSSIELVGKTVDLAGGSQIVAHGGRLTVVAASDPSESRDTLSDDAEARIRVDSGATIDLSGSTANTSVSRNMVTVELRANELADAPLQRDGPLRGKTVVVDARVGTPLAKVDGAVALIGRDVLERTSQGGTAVFDSAGDVIVAENAQVDVSGGAVNYAGGAMRTTNLVRADGSVVDIGSASPDDTYSAVVSPVVRIVDDRWGVIREIPVTGVDRYESGYVEGKSAGSLQFLGQSMVLDGNFLGGTTAGIHQRAANEIPRGATFTIGTAPGAASLNTFRAPEVQWLADPVRVIVGSNAGIPPDLPLFLTGDFVSKGGFSQVNVSSNKGIQIGKGADIDLGELGALTLRAPRLQIDASIHAAGGSINATAQQSSAPTQAENRGLFLGQGVTLDVNGTWTNDSLIPLDQVPTGSAVVSAGRISLTQATDGGTLELGDDIQLLANAGAWLRQSGSLAGGDGGDISIRSQILGTLPQQTRIGSNLSIEGFGSLGRKGGSFTLQAPRLDVSNAGRWLEAQQVSTGTSDGGTLHLGSQLTSGMGFSSVTLIADGLPLQSATGRPTLTVTSGTEVRLQSETLLARNELRSAPSAPDLDGLVTQGLSEEFARTPVSLSLQALPVSGASASYGALVVESGSHFSGDAHSTLALTSRGDLRFGGSVDILSGNVAMSVVDPATGNDQRYIPRTLSVTSGANVDVSGGVIYRPDDTGLKIGEVLPGGTVSLAATRGILQTATGSAINITGAAAEVDRHTISESAPLEHIVATSAAGSLLLKGAEGIAFEGELLAAGGAGNGATDTGGTLKVEVSRVLPTDGAGTFPSGPRRIELANAGSGSVPDNGVATLDVHKLRDSGIETLQLKADDQIAAAAGVDYFVNALTLDAPALGVVGSGTGRLEAGYLTVGPSQSIGTRAQASTGSGVLALHAGQMDLRGSIALQNISDATFESAGDINLQGYGVFSTAPGGLLAAAGNLTLNARRISPTTASRFTISATGANSSVRFGQVGTSPGVPLSAGGSLTVNAAEIVQGGTLLAPFGSLALNATRSLRLLDGSKTSVSGEGSLLPYGRVDNGISWVYGINPNTASIVDSIPDRIVSLRAPDVAMDAGSLVDISGGGDLYAYQFTPGTGGTRDVLAGGAMPDTFVVIPALQGQSAPYDPMMWANSPLTPGTSIQLTGGSAIPAGAYLVLPTRYALLPGAYLVTAASEGYDGTRAGLVGTAVDGAPIVAGYQSFAGKSNLATGYSGYEIRPGSYARSLAQYDDHLASNFFAVAPDEGARPPAPADAGVLSVAVGSSLRALATVRAGAAAGGENATVEIAAPQIRISAAGGAGASGTTELSSSVISGWHAGHLLIGGTRKADDSVDVSARSIDVASGATLTADEIMLAATDSVGIQSGGSVRSTSSSQPSLVLDAANFVEAQNVELSGANGARAALLAVSDLGYLQVTRDEPLVGPGGTVTVASGATLGSRGAVAVDAAGKIELAANTVVAPDASWALGANHIVFGTTNSAPDGLAIDPTLSDSLQGARAVSLRSTTAIDFERSASLTRRDGGALDLISVSAPAIRSSVTGANAGFKAKRIVLSAPGSGVVGATTGGSLNFDADEVEFGDGEIAVSGFDRTSLNAAGVIRGAGNGGIQSTGNLDVTAPAITAQSGARVHLSAQGTLNMTAAGTSVPENLSLETGGTIALDAGNIVVGVDLLAPSGDITVDAIGNLQLGAARIDVTGELPPHATLGSNGGRIHLAAGGDITASPDSELVVSAATGAKAGSIEVQAGGNVTLGGLQGIAGPDHEGGSFELQAAGIQDLAGINRELERNGFDGRRSYRLTNGNLMLASSDSITAREIQLIADSGSVAVDSALVAASGEKRSSIDIEAAGNIDIGANAVLNASASSALNRAGTIELATTAGRIGFASGASVTSTAKDGSGTLTLRAPTTATDVNIDSVPSLSAVDTVILQPRKDYVAGATLDPGAVEAARVDLAAYVAGARSNTLARLGLTSATNVKYQPHAEFSRSGDLAIGALDFSNWRFSGTPGSIGIHATGDISVSGDISDGFVMNGGLLDLAGGSTGVESSSFALNAGRDLWLQPGAHVRTGTGRIQLAAARDIRIDADAGVYTGGRRGAPTIASSESRTNFGKEGGDVFLSAGRDLTGAALMQSPNDWLLRTSYRSPQGSTAAYWGVDFGAFRWSVGALGGGDVSIRTGRDAIDVSAAVADSVAVTTTGARLAFGGGNLRVETGRDVASGYFYVGRGVGDLDAGGGFVASGNREFAGLQLGTLLISGDNDYRISALGDVLLEGELPASGLLPTRSLDDFATDPYVFFNRYGAGSSLTAQSAGGNLTVRAIPFSFLDFDSIASSDVSNRVQANVALSAFGGNLKATVNAISAPNGQLDLYARGDILEGAYVLADTDASLVSPTRVSGDSNYYDAFLDSSAEVLHADDPNLAHVVAGRDISDVRISLPKGVDVRANRDVRNLLLNTQHAGPARTTLVTAGRDLRNVSTPGNITSGSISLGGPGYVEVLAGRNVDLEFSAGITTTGNLANPDLPNGPGADIIIAAGLAGGPGVDPARTGEFVQEVVAPSPENRNILLDYMKRSTGDSDLTYDKAVVAFNGLPVIDQLPLVSQVFFDTLVVSGREAVDDPNAGFKRGFDAINVLFPGSQSSDAAVINPYRGDLTLPFSRIYTLAGGSIALLVPGGTVNVGLATPPTGLIGLPVKGPADLGIVAQGAGSVGVYSDRDVNVNSSRIFTLGGGDIAIWSSRGNIDAGRGAKSAISAPAPVLLVDAQGNVRISVSSAVAGSGIRTISTNSEAGFGDVDLMAPVGFVNAGDAGIGSAGNLTIAAQKVVGLDNIQVGGSSSGVPPEASGLGVSLSGAIAAGSSSTSAAADATDTSSARQPAESLSQNALSWLEVFVLGLGDEVCKPDDAECLKRQKAQ